MQSSKYIEFTKSKLSTLLICISIIVYVVSLIGLNDTLGHFIYMLVLIPMATVAVCKNIKWTHTVNILSLLLTFAVEAILNNRFTSLFAEFVPGYIVTYLISLVLSYSQNIYIRLTQELINKKTIETENEKKTIELEVYTKRLQAEIEERYHAEQVLRKSEEQYRNLVEKAGLGILIDDIDGKLVYFNSRFAEVVGYSEEELKDMNFRDLIHPNDLDFVLEMHNARISGSSIAARYEVRIIRKEGTIFYLEIDAVALVENDKIVGTRSYIWNITNRKLAENALKESEERFRSIFFNAPLGIYRLRPDGTIITANPVFLEMVGTDNLYAVIGKRFQDFLETDDERNKSMDTVIEKREFTEFETEWNTLDGRMMIVRESVWCIVNDHDAIQCFDGICEDVTIKKQEEEERQSLIKQLWSAKSELKVLSGLLPICSSCKRIRDEDGSWAPVEAYIDEHSEAEFSHGICPDCAQKLYPNYY